MDEQPSTSGTQPQSPPTDSETAAPASEPITSTVVPQPSDDNKTLDAATKDKNASGPDATPPDLKTSLQAIIGHLDEVLSLTEKVTAPDNSTLTADGRSILDKLQATLGEHVKIARVKETALLQSESLEQLALPTMDDLEKYDQETRAILSKLQALLDLDKEASESASIPSLDAWFVQFWEAYGDKGKPKEIQDSKPDILVTALAEEEAYQDQSIHLELSSKSSILVSSEGNRTGELVIIQTEPITRELLDRMSYAQVTSSITREDPSSGPMSPAEAASPSSENAGGEKSKANEGGSWFDLVVLVENTAIPKELKTDEGEDELKLAQETKDVLIRVLYGGLWMPKERPRNSQLTEEPTELPTTSNAASSANTSQANPNQRRLTLLEELLGPERKKDQLRWKSHDNVHSTQNVKTIRGAVFGREHEIWKSVKVGDVLGVMACAKGEGWKNQADRVELKFWQHSD